MDNGKAIEYFEGRKWKEVPIELRNVVVKNIRRWMEGDRREAHFMWHNTVGHYVTWLERPLPTLMKLLHPRDGDFRFKEALEDDTAFCVRTGILHGKAGEYLDHIRAAVAEIYWDEGCWVF